jgi:hypothetical protein
VRAAGHVLTSDFIKEWDEGNESFAKDPPNATISVLSSDGKTVEDAVVVLKAPKLTGSELTFEVSVLCLRRTQTRSPRRRRTRLASTPTSISIRW